MTSIKAALPLLVIAALLIGCASQRLPSCKGPYSPIQGITTEAEHGK